MGWEAAFLVMGKVFPAYTFAKAFEGGDSEDLFQPHLWGSWPGIALKKRPSLLTFIESPEKLELEAC